MRNVPSVLSIAGTDPTGGAGIHADLKTFQERKAYGMAVVTSVVAQNTKGVQDVWHVPVDMVEQQIRAVFEDIRPGAVKTGMIATPEMIERVADLLEQENDVPLVIDPVMVATSGDSLMEQESLDLMKKRLLPLSAVITPNRQEAEVLTGLSIENIETAEDAAKTLVDEMGASAAVVKGGHLTGDATDVLYSEDGIEYLHAPRTDTNHTHGTGCSLSASIAAELARKNSIKTAVSNSKAFISKAIMDTLEIGKGNGPINHWASRLSKEDIMV
ncbi:hydroxymethylpyrimidine/phosphomethylpyrimidine kinase [Alteribacillus persepolensis]|uniref:Hydroxymethylpyrimidine/phosphomethylpyrimidine kinase n=1 Tax=Alteribacillus persepolensis TaxID=568899 RepID=A0A1G8FJX1_9BACI|nr:bifunctional hydroxymethylpyrimidine kinase/phosphomethylpyrimidine kinase [Alteribacillus persepolensis]SDH82427.1 hydroxymethylpyrimidine/phosphomethylpyrimidine kinase [Alteribacillus persepolensis]